MVVGDLPVGASGINELVVFPSHGVGAHLTEHFGGVGDFLQTTVLAVVRMPVIHRAEHIDTVFAVVQAEFPAWCVATVLQILVVGQVQVEAEAVTLLFLGADADHSPHRGIILRSRVVDDFHIADVVATQAAQFAVIAHQPPVDIDNWCAFAQDLKAVLAARHAGHFGQHLLCRPRILKH